MKDAHGHGSEAGKTFHAIFAQGANETRRAFQDKYIGGREVASNADAAHVPGSGPKSKPAPIHDMWSNGPPPPPKGGSNSRPLPGANAWASFGR